MKCYPCIGLRIHDKDRAINNAVTTINGTMFCTQHAMDEWQSRPYK